MRQQVVRTTRVSSPMTTGRIGDGCPTKQALPALIEPDTLATNSESRARKAWPSGDRTMPTAANAAAASAGDGAVVNM